MTKRFSIIFLVVLSLILAACAAGQNNAPAAQPALEKSAVESPALPSATPEPTSTPTQTPTVTPTDLPTSTPTSTATATITPTPFPGFSENFKFYQAWVRDETTYFYFMHANVDQTIYARIDDEFDVLCNPDPNYPQHLICTFERFISNRPTLKFDFFADEAHTSAFHSGEYGTGLSESLALFSNCESEYRIYDGRCYYAHTCYDEFGNVVYTADNIPYGGNFEGFSGPCQ